MTQVHQKEFDTEAKTDWVDSWRLYFTPLHEVFETHSVKNNLSFIYYGRALVALYHLPPWMTAFLKWTKNMKYQCYVVTYGFMQLGPGVTGVGPTDVPHCRCCATRGQTDRLQNYITGLWAGTTLGYSQESDAYACHLTIDSVLWFPVFSVYSRMNNKPKHVMYIVC